jgi:ABC-type antimicrobial peptide transport system permease subunit
VYSAQAHFQYFPNDPSIVVRTALPPLSLVEAVRRTILDADPDQPIANVRTLEQAVHKSLAPRRTTLILLGLFAVVAVSLACISIYGVMSHAIGQRARELCIRSALGAQRRDIIRLVFAGGMLPSLAGIALGLITAFALTRVVQSQLFEVKARDPLVFIASICLLCVVAALAIYFPARRAAKLAPMEALRCE